MPRTFGRFLALYVQQMLHLRTYREKGTGRRRAKIGPGRRSKLRELTHAESPLVLHQTHSWPSPRFHVRSGLLGALDFVYIYHTYHRGAYRYPAQSDTTILSAINVQFFGAPKLPLGFERVQRRHIISSPILTRPDMQEADAPRIRNVSGCSPEGPIVLVRICCFPQREYYP